MEEKDYKILSVSIPYIRPVIDSWLKPKLDHLIKNSKLNRSFLEKPIEERFENYLNGVYDKNSYMNTIALQNQQRKIDELYLPLHVISMKDDTVTFKINDFDDKFLPAYKRVLITDTAGMGKSTLLKWLLLSCIRQNKGIPILFELRKLKNETDLLTNIYLQLKFLDDEIDIDFINALIKRGDFIFFLDGFDEIPFEFRTSVSKKIQEFITLAQNNLFLITSRSEPELSSFGDFQAFKIKPLTLDESFKLIKIYDKNGELSKRLISKISESETLKNIVEFLTNPFLVSLLYKAYDYKPLIPFKKPIFYRQVYDSLFETHDLSKGDAYFRDKYSSLDIEDFHRILRVIGIKCMKLGKIDFNKDELLKTINEARFCCPGINFNANDFLKDLIVTVPLFMKDGNNYKWAHKSIQEYFAAKYITTDTKGEQEKILMNLYKSKNIESYLNVLDMCYDIDYRIFRKTIILDILNNFINYSKKYYINYPSRFKKDSLQKRRMLTFEREYIFLKMEGPFDRDKNPNLWDLFDLPKLGFKTDGSYIYSIRFPNNYEDNYYKFIKVVKAERPNYSMYKLLYLKKEKFIIKYYPKNDINIDLPLPLGIPFHLSENPELILNQDANFEQTNEILLFNTSDVGLYLEECIDLKKEIEKENELEIQNNLLFGDL